MSGDRALETLREAVRLSPENIPLRRHLAESLLAQGHPELAEAEFRRATASRMTMARSFLPCWRNALARPTLR